MGDPDVIAFVDRDARHGTDNPLVRQLFRPQRIHAKGGDLTRERGLTLSEWNGQGCKHCTREKQESGAKKMLTHEAAQGIDDQCSRSEGEAGPRRERMIEENSPLDRDRATRTAPIRFAQYRVRDWLQR